MEDRETVMKLKEKIKECEELISELHPINHETGWYNAMIVNVTEYQSKHTQSSRSLKITWEIEGERIFDHIHLGYSPRVASYVTAGVKSLVGKSFNIHIEQRENRGERYIAVTNIA